MQPIGPATGGGALSALAPAKINLCLHVTGRRQDGYHLIQSLVVFADVDAADRLTAGHDTRDRFTLTGPVAEALAEEDDNLVLRARDWLRLRTTDTSPVAITLDKALPVAGGIGGGSADAAAALRLLIRLWSCQDAIAAAARPAICADLGADVAMCIESRALIARGIGDELEMVEGLPALPAVLVNPNVAMLTSAVFAGLDHAGNPPLMPLPDAARASPQTLVRWLARATRNDLEPAARTMTPAIGEALAALDATGALIGRMSGSGATCFGLYGTMAGAKAAAERIAGERPAWWVRACELNPHAEAAVERAGARHVRA